MDNKLQKNWKQIPFAETPNTIIYDTPDYDKIMKIDRENEEDVSTLENYEYDYDSKLLTLLYAAEQILM